MTWCRSPSDAQRSKAIVLEGTVEEALPGFSFKVRLDNGHLKRVRQRHDATPPPPHSFRRPGAGRATAYDLRRGRITYRFG